MISLTMTACTSDSETAFISTSSQPTPTEKLTIWWDKGYILEEDEVLRQVVKTWEKQSGQQVQLDFITADELSTKAQRALQAGHPPDIMMSQGAEQSLNARLAWQGQLADVSDVINPVKSLYPATVLKSAYFYNQVTDRHSYYAVPLNQVTSQIFYWRDLVRQAGKREADIPEDWDGFWQFWQQVQVSLRTKHQLKIYGLGLPMMARARDTYETFEPILEAYDAQIIGNDGQLQVDNPEVRRRIVKALDWYTQFYKQGYVPPEAIAWLNPDNNRSLLNRQVVMTPNNSLSIPAAVRDDPDLYHNKLGTIGYPNKPNGQPMRYIVLVRQAVIFQTSKHQAQAKSFLRYLLQPEISDSYLKAAGRSLPILIPVWRDPFWTNPADPHRSTVAKNLLLHQTRLYAYDQHPAYSMVSAERVWGKAISRIVEDKVSPEQAADEAIANIKQIFQAWPRNSSEAKL
ncbi:MAG: ABC transporter substrate-binding protein [Aphanocapsa sp. GSE-SYN-MK-11-07L]|nr:ABC transporter substrate-binding protein [Aphanocapsa sp. GSE-SYN-MK-11-07L]